MQQPQRAAPSRPPRAPVEDTIVAVSSPAGASPRGIVRLSGPQAIAIAARFFRLACRGGLAQAGRNQVAPSAEVALQTAPNYSALEGDLLLGEDWPAVPTLLYLMRRPASYTREDIVELHLPGSPPLLQQALRRLLAAGARAAQPGEFTRRAFLNGRLDLAQAQAVQRLICARSQAEARAALRQAAGSLSRAVEKLEDRVADALALAEAAIDFSDQDIESLAPARLAERIAQAHDELARLIAGCRTGAVMRESPTIALCGPPGAGKSSLFNRLLARQANGGRGRDRALVAPAPGTTRDVLEAELRLDGLELSLLDTAGISPDAAVGGGELQREASAHAARAAAAADVALLVINSSVPLEGSADCVRRILQRRAHEQVIAVLNKCDLPCRCSPEELRRLAAQFAPESAGDGPCAIVRTSARTGEGIAELAAALSAALLSGAVERSDPGFVIEARQRADLDEAAAALQRAQEAALGPGLEFAALELREALALFARVLGRQVACGDDAGRDVLDRIFSRFCIGK